MKANYFSCFCAVYVSAALSLVLLNAAANAASPGISNQPRMQTVVLYQQAAFGVIASGTPPLTYQWRKDGVPIVGATNDQIVLAHPQLSDAGRYSVVVSNAEGSVTSAEPVLTVNLPKAGDLDFSFAWGGSINGWIASVAVQPDGKVLIGGNFSTVHRAARGAIARLNADGMTDYTFMNGLSGVNGSVDSVALQSDGRVLIGGCFTTVNDIGRINIARLNADGTLDSGFQNGLSGASGSVNTNIYPVPCVSSVAVQSDGKVLIGGKFTMVNGVSRTNIARLNADGTLDSEFQNGLSGIGGTKEAPGVVSSITVQSDGKVLIGGGFATINGVTRHSVARVNTDGSVDSSFQNGLSGTGSSYAYGYVFSVAVQSDGKVIIGGGFTTVNGVGRNNLARLDTDGMLDRGFQDGLSGVTDLFSFLDVSSVAVQSDGKVLVGGNGIARLNTDGTLDRGFLNRSSNIVSAVALQSNGKVLIGGVFFFTTANGLTRNHLARLNDDGSLDSSFLSGQPGPDDEVNSVALQKDGKVLIGGQFRTVNGVSRGEIARLNADGTLDNGFLNGLSGADFTVSSIVVQGDGKILIGGYFTTVNGVSRNHIARLNADGTLDGNFLNGLSGADGGVQSIAAQSDGKVLIAGEFHAVNGVSRHGIARLNADGTLDSSFLNGLSGANAYVSSVWLQRDGNVLIGGAFTTVNGAPALGIGRVWGEAVPPGLTIVRSADTAIISWPPSGASFGLQSTTNLTMPNSWSSVVENAVTNNGRITVGVSVANGNRFFRLRSAGSENLSP